MASPASPIAGRYELLSRLGQGAAGQVWRALDLVLEREVAIKLVDLAHQDDPAAESRFRRESITMAGLIHPNVVSIFDAGTDGTTAYLVMELLNGPDLRQLVARHPQGTDYATVLPIMAQVAMGLEAAHRLGVVHRDIKPANIVMQRDTPKIVDFGIATLSDTNASATLTAPSTAIGTASYMSPEQAMGKRVRDAGDWYSFGCCLMALFSGQPPFLGNNPLAVATAQITEPPPRLTDRRPDAPYALDVLIDRLLAKQAADRPTGSEVIDQLTQLIASPTTTPLLAEPTPTTSTAAIASTPDLSADTSSGTHTRVIPALASETWDDAPEADRRPARRGRRWPWLVLLIAIVIGGYLFGTVVLPQLRSDPVDVPTLAPTTNIPAFHANTPAAVPHITASSARSAPHISQSATPSTSPSPAAPSPENTPATPSKPPQPLPDPTPASPASPTVLQPVETAAPVSPSPGTATP